MHNSKLKYIFGFPSTLNSKNPPLSNLSFTTHGVQSKLVLSVDSSPLNRSHKREQFDVGVNLPDMNKIKCLIILWGHYSHCFVLGEACYHTPRAWSKLSSVGQRLEVQWSHHQVHKLLPNEVNTNNKNPLPHLIIIYSSPECTKEICNHKLHTISLIVM